MMNHTLASSSFAIAFLASTAAFAQGNTATQPPASMNSATTTQFSPTDQNFIDEAAVGGQFEVQPGKLDA